MRVLYFAICIVFSINAVEAFEGLPEELNPPSILFRENSVLKLTIRADFEQLKNKDEYRHWEKAKSTIAFIQLDEMGGRIIKARLSPAGRSRMSGCTTLPLFKVSLVDHNLKDTSFEGLENQSVKIVPPCLKDEEDSKGVGSELVAREFTEYKLLEALQVPHLKVRLAEVIWMNRTGQVVASGYSFFIENKASLENRYGLNAVSYSNIPRSKWSKLNLENGFVFWAKTPSAARVAFHLGRLLTSQLDKWGLDTGHNVEFLVQGSNNKPTAILNYDFDRTPIVNPAASILDLRIPSWKDLDMQISSYRRIGDDELEKFLRIEGPSRERTYLSGSEMQNLLNLFISRRPFVEQALRDSTIRSKNKFTQQIDDFFNLLNKLKTKIWTEDAIAPDLEPNPEFDPFPCGYYMDI